MPSKPMLLGLLAILALGLGLGSASLPRTVAQSSGPTASRLYQLEFVQESNCPYGSWVFPWAVVLDNSSVVVQPSNATLPLTYNSGGYLTSDANYSTIVFSVPDGTYNYTVAPKDPFNGEQSGSVTVDGSDVQVQVGFPLWSLRARSRSSPLTTVGSG